MFPNVNNSNNTKLNLPVYFVSALEDYHITDTFETGILSKRHEPMLVFFNEAFMELHYSKKTILHLVEDLAKRSTTTLLKSSLNTYAELLRDQYVQDLNFMKNVNLKDAVFDCNIFNSIIASAENALASTQEQNTDTIIFEHWKCLLQYNITAYNSLLQVSKLLKQVSVADYLDLCLEREEDTLFLLNHFIQKEINQLEPATLNL